MLDNQTKYTVDEHYVSRFVVENFADARGYVQVVDIANDPPACYKLLPKNILYERDMYEFRNADGTYFDRNAVENWFSSIENVLAPELRDVLHNQKAAPGVKREKEAWMALLLAFQLVRIPAIKKPFANADLSKACNTESESLFRNAFYHMALRSDRHAFNYLEGNGLTLSEADKKLLGGKSLLSEVASFILSECFIYLMTSENRPFCLPDMPVLIDAFQDAKYIYPVAPRHAIACCLFSTASQSQADGFAFVDDSTVKVINQLLIGKATRHVICNPYDKKEVIELMGG